MAYFRNAQSFYLGGTQVRQGAAGPYTLTGTLETDLLLEDLIIQTDNPHMLTDVTVAGQSIFASDQAVPTTALQPNSWLSNTGHKSMSIPLAARQQVAIQGDSAALFGPAAASNIAFAIGTAPIAPAAVIPVNQLGAEALSYVVGMGDVAVGAGGTAQLQCTIRRPVMLGALVLDFDAGNVNDLVVRSITVNNVQMLSGETGALGEIPLGALVPDSSDIDGKIIGYPAPLNGQISIEVFNNGAAPVQVAGCIFTLPTRPSQG